MIKADFTLQDVLALIGASECPNLEGYRSAIEWADHLGIPEYRMGAILRAAARRGALKSERKWGEGIDGRRCSTPVYSFVVDGH
jgi:hypothetical protein